MVDQRNQRTAAIPKIKLLLIPVLAVALAIILIQQRQSKSGVDVAATAESVVALNSRGNEDLIATGSNQATDLVHDRPHQRIALNYILSHNPFDFSDSLNPADPNSHWLADSQSPSSSEIEMGHRQQLLERWQSVEMTAFYQSGSQPVAMVDNRVLHVGEILDGGVRVVEISPEGITYEVCIP